MSIISRNKHKLIALVRYLDQKPGFRRLFYHVHQIRKDDIHTERYLAVETSGGFLLGTYRHYAHILWKRIAEGEFEPRESSVAVAMAPLIDVFIDIGAHIGYYTCLMSHIAPQVQVISFEPSPENFRSLSKNIQVNGFSNVRAHEVALSDRPGKASLYGSDATGSLVKDTYAAVPEDETSVKVSTLDSFSGQVPTGSRIFVKIDVEGNEYAVLRGAQSFISSHKPLAFLLEVSKNWESGPNPNYFDTFTFMAQHGYKAFVIEGVNEVRAVDPKEDLQDVNYLFLRKDQDSLIQALNKRPAPKS